MSGVFFYLLSGQALGFLSSRSQEPFETRESDSLWGVLILIIKKLRMNSDSRSKTISSEFGKKHCRGRKCVNPDHPLEQGDGGKKERAVTSVTHDR